jgi:hypothetical protein
MSTNSSVLDDTLPVNPHVGSPDLPGAQSAARPSEYAELVKILFRGPAVVAVLGAASGCVTDVCEGIASELSRLERRVVLVSVQRLLRADPVALPDETVLMPGSVQNIGLWPPPVALQTKSSRLRGKTDGGTWIDTLRRNFDSVLLDCPAVQTSPGSAPIAAMADAAVLTVEVARTSKQKIVRDQRTLQFSGVKLSGFVLLKER